MKNVVVLNLLNGVACAAVGFAFQNLGMPPIISIIYVAPLYIFGATMVYQNYLICEKVLLLEKAGLQKDIKQKDQP